MTTYTAKLTDSGDAAVEIKLQGYTFGQQSNGGVTKFTSLTFFFGIKDEERELTQLLQAYGRGDPYDALVIDVRNDTNQLVQRVTLSQAFISSLLVHSDTGEGTASVEFVFDRVKVEAATTPGGPLNVVFETTADASFVPNQAPDRAAVIAGDGDDFSYTLEIGGNTLVLAGYELGFSQPIDSANGSPSGQRIGRPLLVHLKEPAGEGDVDELFDAAFTNAPLGDAKIEVRNSDGKIVHTISLTGASVQAQASANGGGEGQSVFALNYGTLNFAAFEPGADDPDVETTFITTAGSEDGSVMLVPANLAEIAPDAQLRPGNTLTLNLANGAGEPIALKGIEFDFARITTGRFSPLIVHVGDVRGEDGLVRLLTAFNTNASLGTATIALKDENEVVLKQVTLTNARIVGQSMAGGGGGSDVAVALVFDSIQFATEPRPAPMTGFERIAEAAGPLTFETEPLNLGALATVATGGSLSYSLELNGLTLELSGYELDVRRPFDAAGVPTAASTYSPLLVQIKGKGGDAQIVALVNAAANNLPQGDATLVIKNSDNHMVGRIRLGEVAVGAAALAAGTARNETTLALTYKEIGIDRFDGLGDDDPDFSTDATLTEAQAAATAFVSQAEFSEIAKTTQVRTGGKSDITIEFKLGTTTTKFDLDGYEFDLFRSTSASYGPVVVQFGGAPGERDLVGLMAAFATGASYDLATIEVKNGNGEVTQTLTLTNPRFAAQALGAGGGGADSAAALLYDRIDLFAAGSGGSSDKTFSAVAISFDPTRPKLGGLATQPDGSDFNYFLTFNGNVTPLAGYELDLLQPVGTDGAPTTLRESKPLILHFDGSAGNSALVQLLDANVKNTNLATATIDVRNGNNVLVNRIVLTNASVEVMIREDGGSDGEAAVALNYASLDFEHWDGENPAAAVPEASVRLTADGAPEAGNVTLVPVTAAELALETNAVAPGWIAQVIEEVQDFFTFIRKDAPQRALGLDELPTSPFAASGFSALAAGDPELPSLSEVPIIGDKLLPAIQNGLDIFRDVEARIIEALNSLPDEEDAAAALADRINQLGIDGLEAEAEGTSVRLIFAAEDFVDLALDDIKVSLGGSSFGLDLEADLAARIEAALNASIQIDVATGEVEILDNGVDELSINLTAGGNFTADAALGFLDITVTDNNPEANEISFDFGLDVAAGRIADLTLEDIDLTLEGSAKLDLHIVTATPVTILPTIAADFVVDWSTSAAPGEGLLREVAFNNVTLDVRSILQTLAEVFQPLADIFDTFPIDLFIDSLTTPLPVIDTLARKIGATSLLDFVPASNPDGTLNMLDVAVIVLKIQGGEGSAEKIAAISVFAEALSAIESITGDALDDDFGLIDLGSFSFTDPAGSSALAARASGENGFASLAAADGSGIERTGAEPTDPFDQLDAAIANSDAYKDGVEGRKGLSVLGPSPFADGFNDISGFSIPLLNNNGADAIKILLNAAFPDDPVTIIQYDMPALEFAGGYERFFPIVGPIGAVLRGDFGGRVDLAIGYDTKGLASGGLSDFEEGFFFTTQEFTPGSGIYEPLAKLFVGISAGAAINIGVAQAGVFGGIVAETSGFLNDGPDNDGKLRLSELDICFIDPITGKFTAELTARLKIGVGFFSWTRTFKIADATLLDFSFGCDGASSAEMGGLATIGPDGSVAAGTLQLNVGSRAGLRNSIVPEYRIDDDEHFAVRNAVDENGVAIAGALQVAAFTVIETFGADPAIPASIIKASFGADDDSLVIAEDVLTPSDIHGNAGDDLLIGGGGADTLHGDDGEDVLDGGAGDDRLNGGKGEDLLEGRAGADYLDGGVDQDQVTYELSPVGVMFREIPAIGGQSASEGEGGDAQGDILVSIEYIIGSRFNDQFYGNRNAPNILEGIEGNDILSGGIKDDHMLGGPGADMLFGLAGRDGTSYLTSSGAVQIDLVTGQGKGGDAEGDRLVSMEDVHGTVFGDVLRGSASANLLDGFYGDDVIEGRGGGDEVFGREGDDTIFALADGDDIDGGPGRDLLSYRNRTAGGATVNLKTGDGGGSDEIAPDGSGIDGFSSIEDLDGTNLLAHNDILGGDRGNNRIRGLAGVDGLFGDDGDDILIGGTQGDVMIGGNGRDLADYRDSASRVEVDLTLGQGFTGDAQGDSLASIENLRGSEFPDILIGDAFNNRIDPGLARFTTLFGPIQDIVDGRGGADTLVIDYSRSDTGQGIVGGYDFGSSFGGVLGRNRLSFGIPLDSVTFSDIERLEVIGTFKNDVVYGGGGDDLIITGSGNDTVYGGGRGIYPLFDSGQRLGTMIGSDRILAGDGNDSVFYGTNEFRALARDIQQSFGPFYLDGGRGIDTLSISLAHLGNDIVIVGSPDGSEALSTNLNFGGSYVANFEILGSVFTGSGRDVITQTGDHDNIFDAGAGEDVITSGLGTDEVFGGTDFSPPFEGPLVIDFTENSGDLLILDYSGLETETGVTGEVFSIFAPQTNDPRLNNFQINVGTYTYEDGEVEFKDIERLDVTGSNQDDLLVGTDNLAQNRFGFFNDGPVPSADSNETLRGADRLLGLGGNDEIVGNNGSDTIEGGDGNDTLIGPDPNRLFTFLGGRAYTDNYIDQTEVDYLTGNEGADLFVLGTEHGFYYGYTPSLRSEPALDENNANFNDLNRAIITDFNPDEGDRLQLFADATYTVVEVEGSTRLYLNEGNGQRQWIAELEQYSGLVLDETSVVYANGGAQFAAAKAAPAAFDQEDAPVITSLEKSEPAALALTVPDWITQNNDPGLLRQVLLGAIAGSAIDAASLTVTLDGNGEAFGTFDGDPFGLGAGLILSSGKVTDLQGPNLEDGALGREKVAEIQFEFVGRADGSDIFRANLTGLGFDLNSITLPDSNSRLGGSGDLYSGFDLDQVMLSRTLADGFPAQLLDVFDFSAASIVFRPGTYRFTSNLEFAGLRNGIIKDPSHFGRADGFQDIGNDIGWNSLGDGGVISFNLTEPVSTEAPLYLYVSEFGGTGETVSGTIRASDQRIGAVADLSTDFGELGEANDTTTMTFSFARAAGSTDDTIMFSFVMFSEELPEFSGSAFNDTVKITLNGESLAQLTDGAALTVNNLMAAPLGQFHPDLILNPAGEGPLTDSVRADAFTRTLTFAGALRDQNIITIEVRDTADGTLDTGVLVRAATAGGLGTWTTTGFNNPPVFTDLDGFTTFNAGAPAATLDPTASVLDTELAATGNYAGASLTLSRLGGAATRDVFGATGAVTFSSGDVLVPSTSASPVGTVTNAGGLLSIIFNANASQAAVDAVLTSITYLNSAPPLAEDVNILWRFSDGNGGAQGLGGALEAIGLTTVEVSGGNTAPLAVADALSVDEDATTADLVAQILANDEDPDLGDVLTILSIDTTGTLGGVVFDPVAQTLVYSADHPSFDALDPTETALTSFAYTVRDSAGAMSTSTVTITIDGKLNDDDYIYGTPLNDILTGGDGRQKFRALAGNDTVRGEAGDDRIEAGPGNDILYGGSGFNRLFGEDGNDTFGNETIASLNGFDGGPGSDTLITRAAVGQVVTVDLVAGTLGGGFMDGSTIASIENVKNGSTNTAVIYLGDGAANGLTGGLLADTLRGRGGNDNLLGSSGADLIDGGAGADVLGGGIGNDVFVLRPGETHGDRLQDFAGNGANPGDFLSLEGFGPGATLTASRTSFTINHAGGSETFTMNTAMLHPSDFAFIDPATPSQAAASFEFETMAMRSFLVPAELHVMVSH